MNAFLIVLAIAVLSALAWFYRRQRDNDRFEAVMSRRKLTASICSRAQWIEGGNAIPVALALEPQRLSYENVDLDASIDLDQIDEVEYGSDLVRGGTANGSVLRVRSHGRAIEFVLDRAAAEQWSHSLPAHQMTAQ